jgi:hypothetical protein
MCSGLGTGRIGVHIRCPEGGESFKWRPLWGGGGGVKAAEVAGGPAAFEVRAVSSVLCRFRLRTSLKPSSCVDCSPADFGALVWPAGVLALSTAFKSPNVTLLVYVL